MFLNNKYTKWYYLIIENAKNKDIGGYTEKHHIVPKSLGGNNNKENLVSLTAKEHFICHLLLTKIVDNKNNKVKMVWALWRMCNGRNYKPTSRSYEAARKKFIKSMTGHPNWMKSQTDKTKEKISKTLKSKLANLSEEEMKKRLLNSFHSPESWTEDRKKNISKATTGKSKTKTEKFYRSKEKTRKQRTERMLECAKKNKGKTWKLIDGKRVWMEKKIDKTS